MRHVVYLSTLIKTFFCCRKFGDEFSCHSYRKLLHERYKYTSFNIMKHTQSLFFFKKITSALGIYFCSRELHRHSLRTQKRTIKFRAIIIVIIYVKQKFCISFYKKHAKVYQMAQLKFIWRRNAKS